MFVSVSELVPDFLLGLSSHFGQAEEGTSDSCDSFCNSSFCLSSALCAVEVHTDLDRLFILSEITSRCIMLAKVYASVHLSFGCALGTDRLFLLFFWFLQSYRSFCVSTFELRFL